ncbi:MAG: hypothetical protein IH598_07240 [Bacteroidales bacterium]|nr:hypothetical protein [Bacteroidales bacterium]
MNTLFGELAGYPPVVLQKASSVGKINARKAPRETTGDDYATRTRISESTIS